MPLNVIALTSNNLNHDPVFVDPNEIVLIVENRGAATPYTAVVIKAGNAVTVLEDAATIRTLIEQAKANGAPTAK